MFDTEFYPTPKKLAEQMIEPYLKGLTSKRVLDPSAGAGALLDVCREYIQIKTSRYNTPIFTNLHGIEIDLELRMILLEKGYKVIGSDFLEFNEPTVFDLVVMNPPFSVGAKHILQAWLTVDNGGDLVALCNWETIANPKDSYRQALAGLIEKYGTVENIGKAFADAERPADVEIGLIRLTRPETKSYYDFDGGNFEKEQAIADSAFESNPLAHTSIIKSLVSQYEGAVRIATERHNQQLQLDAILKGISRPVDGTDADKYCKTKDSLEQRVSLREQLAAIKSMFWNTLFHKSKISNKMTSQFKAKFEKFAIAQADMAFSERNIIEALSMFFQSRDEIMKEAIAETFDKLTAYDEKNIIHYEGWKTNKCWRINKKVIIPGGCYKSYGSFEFHVRSMSLFADMDRIMCYLTGTSPDKEGYKSLDRAADRYRWEYPKTNPELAFDSYFFTVRVFKKGTVHISFKDLDALAKFNKAAAEGKNWLPPTA